jgi:hypothetical protein
MITRAMASRRAVLRPPGHTSSLLSRFSVHSRCAAAYALRSISDRIGLYSRRVIRWGFGALMRFSVAAKRGERNRTPVLG